MSEDKRTKIGPTGAVPVQASQTPVPAAASNVTEYMHPTGTPAPSTPAPSATPAPHQHQTSYLPPVAPQVDPLLGQTLAGRYLISKKLGEGGMGAVYMATHQLLEKQVALKVLHNEFARKADLVERFIQEAKAASRIRHENVIDISDFGTTPEGVVFFAMELLNGHDLHEEVARARLAGQLLPFSRTKKIFLQICAALSAAHSKGIVHRDLKPENVYLVEFLGDGDFVKLLDFGIAKLTEVNEEGRKLTKTGMLFGTPEYMSPEQARGEQVDHRVDVYAMGCILFQLVTGRVPFEADNFMGVLSLHLTEHPPEIPSVVFDRIGAPHQIAQVIERALLKDRDQRFQTIDDLANAIRVVCGDPIVQSGRTTGPVAAASVQAPERTTQARPSTPTPPPMTPISSNPLADGQRQRTQWTGSLNVPIDEAPTKPKSKLPMIVGGIGLVAIAGVAVFFATRGGKTNEPVVGSASGGSQAVNNPPPLPTPDAAVVAPELPDYSEVKLDTNPPGAEITEVATNTKWGKTPKTLRIVGSNTARQFRFTLKGYNDTTIEIAPNKAKIDRMETLEKGGGTVTRVGSGSATVGSGSAVVKAGSGSAVVKAVPIDAGVTRPPPDECDDPPCIKKVVKGITKCVSDSMCGAFKCIDGICN